MSAVIEHESNAVAVRNPLDLDVKAFQSGLDRRKANRAMMMDWIREALVKGTDFDAIHVVSKDKCQAGRNCKNKYHFSKPSLFKPGAEKICGMLGLKATWPTLADYEAKALEGATISQILLRCEIQDAAGNLVAQGVGARTVKQDYGDLNKALKMAKKSGFIDAVLSCAGLSELFTLDVEDMPKESFNAAPPPPQAAPASAPTAPPRNPTTHCTYGKNDGVAWADMKDGNLMWYAGLGENGKARPDTDALAAWNTRQDDLAGLNDQDSRA